MRRSFSIPGPEGDWEYPERVSAASAAIILAVAGEQRLLAPIAENPAWLGKTANSSALIDPKVYAGLYFLGTWEYVKVVRQ